VHLLNLTVDPGLRRYEVGTQFVDKLKTKLGGRRNAIHFQIRETNTPGVLFFARQGFAAIDVKRGYFDDTAEDAYVMRFLHRPERDPFAEEEEQFRNRVSRYLGGTR
jgi:ribosomal protein S18 acetylase RimI-like enzyme